MNKIKTTTYFIALPVFLILAWLLITHLELIDPFFLPPPQDLFTVLTTWITPNEITPAILTPTKRSLIGFFISSAIAVPLGLLIGRSKPLDLATRSTIDFFRSIPATALLPLFLLILGIGDESKYAIVIYAASLVIIINTIYGARSVKQARIDWFRVHGASKPFIFWNIILKESLPSIFAGLRIGLSFSFVLVVVAEMFAGTNIGLGFKILNYQMVYKLPEMYAAIILTGLLGFLFNSCFIAIEKKTLHWSGK